MYTTKRFAVLALLFALLLDSLPVFASEFYIVPGSNGSAKYLKASSGSYSSSYWTQAESASDEKALHELFYRGDDSSQIISAGDTVYIKSGTYKTTQTIDLRKDVTIYGGFSGSESSISARNLSKNITTIDGSGLTDPISGGGVALSPVFYINKHSFYTESNYTSSHGIYTSSGTTATITLDGLKIANNPGGTTYWGGGIRIEGGIVTITNCNITNNKTVLDCGSEHKAGSGGGIYIEGKQYNDSDPVTKVSVTNCSITNNTGGSRGGGIMIGYSDNDPEVLIENCLISGNECNGTENGAIGGGICIESGKVEITNCTIINNKAHKSSLNSYYPYGGGVGTWYPYSATSTGAGHGLTITNCTIINNEADKDETSHGGGLWIYHDLASVINCTIANNSANYGGAFAATTASFTNTLIANNSAATRPDCGSYTGSTQTLTNCAVLSGVSLPDTITSTSLVTISSWSNTKTYTASVDGVTHTVYRIEDNSELKSLFGAGKALSEVKTDQLNQTRASTPCIGAVEGFVPVITSGTSYSITATEGTEIDSATITATGENLSWKLDKTLPNGFSSSSGTNTFTISGTPAVGTASLTPYTYTLTASNGAGSDSADITITIWAVTPRFDQTSAIRNFIEGKAIDTITINAIAGDNLTWTMTGSLPNGLTGKTADDKKSFVISGTPQKGSAGSYQYTITATNVTNASAKAVVNITVIEPSSGNGGSVAVTPALSVSEISFRATENSAIEPITINALAGENLIWTQSGSLPSGITGRAADDNKSFVISGTPAQNTAGSYEYTVTAANSKGEASAVVKITIIKSGEKTNVPVLSESELAVSATEGRTIQPVTITASSPVNFTWSASGTLPAGLVTASDEETFRISGTPSEGSKGSYTYTVTARNSAGSSSAVIKITVNAGGEDIVQPDNFRNYEIPDDETEKTLTEALGSLTTDERKQIIHLTLNENITDLAGLSDLLPNLTTIDLSNASGLKEADFSGNTTLKYADLSNNTSIQRLVLTDSHIENVDAEKCEALEEVNISGCEYIKELNMPECPNAESVNAEDCISLQILNISSCGNVRKLNVSGCSNLIELYFDGNAIRKFDARPFTKLSKLESHTQRVRNIAIGQRFNLSDFLAVSIFDSDYDSEYEDEDEVEASAIELDNNVKNLTGYDSDGSKIKGEYDSSTGEYVFTKAPARIDYDYDTGFKSTESMDVQIISSGTPNNNENNNKSMSSGGGGGCNTGFASLGLLIAMGIFAAKKR